MYVILLGAPGAGKGTQAESLAERYGVAHVATGDLFREAAKKGTELGQLAKSYMDRGELVPDQLTIQMVMERLKERDCQRGVILDGFPRTVEQAKALKEALVQQGKGIDVVLYIEVSDETLLNRLSGRYICRACQTPYHILFNPPRVEGVCNACGGPLYQRDDDRREVSERRLEVYFRQTSPLINFYETEGVLRKIDGEQSVEQVGADLVKVLDQVARSRNDGVRPSA
ncbi:MAG: adenylate kinase [Chloroflexi bacterium]|nr:adenylate kinase [Chloroflexota bacterium]